MGSRSLFILVVLLISLSLGSSFVVADKEPNDDFQQAEPIGEGEYEGDVEWLGDDENDYYALMVPGKKDLVVWMKCVDSTYMVMSSYDEDMVENSLSCIFIFLSEEGESEEQSWYNDADESKILFLEIHGRGSYEFTIEYTDETASQEEERTVILTGVIICIALGIIIPVLFLVAFIVGLVFFLDWRKKRKKEKELEPMQMAPPPIRGTSGSYPQRQTSHQQQYPQQRGPPQNRGW